MKTETEILLPTAANEFLAQPELTTEIVAELRRSFAMMFAGAEDWIDRANAIQITDESQIDKMAEAREARLELKSIRIAAEKARKEKKAGALTFGRAVDGIANVLKVIIDPVEKDLLEKEKFAERAAEARRAELQVAREAEIAPYREAMKPESGTFLDYCDFPETQWKLFLAGVKKEYEDLVEGRRLLAEKKAADELAAAAKEREEMLERERVRKENALLKKQAAEAAAAAAKERAEATRVIEAERRERAEAEAAAAKVIADEKAKAEKERERIHAAAVKMEKQAAEAAAAAAEERKEVEARLRAAEASASTNAAKLVAADKARKAAVKARVDEVESAAEKAIGEAFIRGFNEGVQACIRELGEPGLHLTAILK